VALIHQLLAGCGACHNLVPESPDYSGEVISQIVLVIRNSDSQTGSGVHDSLRSSAAPLIFCKPQAKALPVRHIHFFIFPQPALQSAPSSLPRTIGVSNAVCLFIWFKICDADLRNGLHTGHR